MPDPVPPVTPVTPPATPESVVPAKFKNADGTPNVEALAKSYIELEKSKYGNPRSETPADPPVEQPEGLALTPDAPNALANLLTVETILKKSGLKAEDLQKQWSEHGELTPAQYSKFGLAGLSKELAHELVGGIAAKAQLRTQNEAAARGQAEVIAGGKDQHETLRAWAKANWSPAKLNGWKNLVEADPSNYIDMVRAIAGDYAAKNGDKSELVNAESVATDGAKPAENSKEFAKLLKAANGGDAAAWARINATSQATINGWTK